VAHELYPQCLTADDKGTFKVGLGPDLKFAGLVGLGESRPYWQFAHHEARPLLGC
jgi:hypothetical protein